MLNHQSSHQPAWRFWLPLLFQIALILGVPAQAIYTHITGTTVILQTVPVDPYDFLRGYYQTLRYDISRAEDLNQLPGWDTLLKTSSKDGESLAPGTSFYVILAAPQAEKSPQTQPQPWQPIAVDNKLPQDLPTNQVAIEGKFDYGWIDYGLKKYYLPEDQREEINAQIRKVGGDPSGARPFVVEIKVNKQGKAVPVSLWVSEKNYRF